MKNGFKKAASLHLLLTLIYFTTLGQSYEITTEPFPLPLVAGEILVDHESDEVWITTSTGAARYTANAWHFFDQTNGLNIDSVYHLAKDSDGAIWFMGTQGVARFKDGQWSKYFDGVSDHSGKLSITNDLLWLKYSADWTAPLLKISSTDTTEVTIDADKIVQDIYGNYWGYNHTWSSRLYVSTDAVHWSDSIIYDGLRDFHIDESGNQWLVTSANKILYRKYQGPQVDIGWFQADVIELPLTYAPPIQCITTDHYGNLYIGTYYSGMYIKTKNGWIHLTSDNELSGNIINDITSDNKGKIWITSTTEEWSGREASGVSVLTQTVSGWNDLNGIVYADQNNNGIQDDDESGIPNLLIELTEPGHYAISDTEGEFSFAPLTGENTITVLLKDFWEAGQTPLSYTFVYPNEVPQFNIGLKWKEVHDAAVSLNANAARPGFDTNYYIHIRNEGSVTEDVEVTLLYDPLLTFISSNQDVTSSSEGVLTFNMNELQAQQGKTIELLFNLPPTVPLGTILKGRATVSSLAGETAFDDNIDSIEVTVTGSFDPNDKLVKEGILEEGYVELGKPLTYTIRFQNTGTDYAFNIKILDTLDPHFDLSTLEVLGSSHAMTYKLDNRTLKFIFNDIMLPDSTNNEPKSHGYVTYRIKPYTETLNNTIVLNSAAIYFDFNEPVITNEVSNLLVTELPSDEVLGTEDQLYKSVFYPNPVVNQTLHLKDEARQFYSADLISLNGVVLQHFNLLENPNELKLETVPSGVYVLKFANHQKILVARVVITK